MLQVAVQCTAYPRIVLSHYIGANPPGSKNVMFKNIGRGALFAFGEGGKNGILPGAPESIAKLEIIPVLDLADADLSEV
jgi:hypothetical protein